MATHILKDGLFDRLQRLGPFQLTWINFNPNMHK